MVSSDSCEFLFFTLWLILLGLLRELLLGFHESCYKFEMLAGIDILDLREWTKKRQPEDRISSAEDQTTLVIPGESRDSEDI